MSSIFLHRFLYSLITIIYLIYLKFARLKLKFGRNLTLNEFVEIRDSGVFKKKNDHVALIVNYEDNQPITDDNLAKLISWTLIFRIPFLSIYDHDGILIEKRQIICEKVTNYLEKNVNIVGKFKITQGVHERLFDVKGENNYNGKLRFIDSSDGKEKVVKAVKEIVQERLVIGNNNLVAINDEFSLTQPSLLTNRLREEFEFPDPDMGIICSLIYNVYGYPPWEIRYTEFVLIPDLYDINLRNFRECFALFNKKEQRKGR